LRYDNGGRASVLIRGKELQMTHMVSLRMPSPYSDGLGPIDAYAFEFFQTEPEARVYADYVEAKFPSYSVSVYEVTPLPEDV
jgi:hypothetical protein